jgi:hypothetical protein
MAYRSIVAVPMLKDGRPIGAIAMARSQTGVFPEREMDELAIEPSFDPPDAAFEVRNWHMSEEAISTGKVRLLGMTGRVENVPLPPSLTPSRPSP